MEGLRLVKKPRSRICSGSIKVPDANVEDRIRMIKRGSKTFTTL